MPDFHSVNSFLENTGNSDVANLWEILKYSLIISTIPRENGKHLERKYSKFMWEEYEKSEKAYRTNSHQAFISYCSQLST